MSATPSQDIQPLPAPSCRDLLGVAYRLGLADGRYAGHLQLPEDPDALGGSFRGRDPTEFAHWLWGDRPQPPPAGLALNAGHWYIQGFREGLAAFRHPASVGSPPADEVTVVPASR